jgi:pimeloyl-ACP methyl ester carboxylesterase
MKKIIMKLIGFYINALAIVAPRYAGRFGLALFCRPFRGKITARQKEFLQSANRFSLAFQKETIAGYSWGNGAKKILLVHGWQSHTYRWKIYVEQLIKLDYTVFAFDAPGHGLSTGNFLSVPLYSEVIEKMLLHMGKPDAIVGHSLGGFSALYTLHKNPALSSDKLVVMAAPGEAAEFFEFYKAALRLSQRSMNLIINRFKQLFGHGPEYFSGHKFASTIDVPGLIIHDEDDDETSVEHSKRVHQHWGNSRLHVTKGFGHNLKSIQVVNEVVQFINHQKAQVEVPTLTSRSVSN